MKKKIYKIVFVVGDERKVEIATSITAVKKLLKGVTVYRIYDESETDITGDFYRTNLVK